MTLHQLQRLFSFEMGEVIIIYGVLEKTKNNTQWSIRVEGWKNPQRPAFRITTADAENRQKCLFLRSQNVDPVPVSSVLLRI
jgi:hypothetical protein